MLQLAGFGAFHLFRIWRFFDHAFEGVEENLPGVVERVVLADDGAKIQDAGLIHLLGAGQNLSGFFVIDQRFIEAAGRGLAEYAGQDIEGRLVRMAAVGSMKESQENLVVAHAANHGHPFAVLRGFDGVSGNQRAAGSRNCAEIAVDHGDDFGFVNLARYGQHGIIRLIELTVEGLQILNRHALHVGAIADHRAAVRVGGVSGGHHVFIQNAHGTVLAALELIADDGEFLIEVGLADKGVHHAVGLKVESPFQVFVGALERFIVICAVVSGAAIGAGTVLRQLLRDVGVFRAAFEDHVLQKMGHATFAGTFVARADEISHVDGDGGLRRIGKDEQAQTVGQLILGDAFDGCNSGDAFRQVRLRGGGQGCPQDGTERDDLEKVFHKVSLLENVCMLAYRTARGEWSMRLHFDMRG